MKNEEDAAEKRTAIEYPEFGKKTSKRVAWEAWEFTIVGPHLVRVTKASYGYLKNEHSYLVGIKDRDGIAVPAECECPADLHQPGDCKHKLALATVGGPILLEAACAFEGSPRRSELSSLRTAADALRTDGGSQKTQANGSECTCGGADDFPCWPCYRDRKWALPE